MSEYGRAERWCRLLLRRRWLAVLVGGAVLVCGVSAARQLSLRVNMTDYYPAGHPHLRGSDQTRVLIRTGCIALGFFGLLAAVSLGTALVWLFSPLRLQTEMGLSLLVLSLVNSLLPFSLRALVSPGESAQTPEPTA